MPLTPGTRLGSYEIAAAVGAGGMGEVYRARDTSLKRDVAIKVLPASFANDADRLARFQREAEVLASLNHANIAQIYGIERSENTTALAMELVEGPTLAERIAQGPIPVDEAIGLALQLAEALEAAHGRGIVHRDLKPANIKLTPDGIVKVLDFGIAKVPEPGPTSGGRSPTLLTPALTEAGVLLGTAAYMAPEQARGRAVDQRADIWAFGCVLYEMLTGQPAFGGEDVTTTLARILEREADLKSLPASLSPTIAHTIRLCLRKDPRKRLRDIGDVRLALEGDLTLDLDPHERGGRRAQTPSRLIAALSAAVAAAAVTTAAIWLAWPNTPASPVSRFEHPIQERLGNRGRRMVAISPDGRYIAYTTVTGLYLRALDELEPRLIQGTQTDMTGIVFSPDGQYLAYWDRRRRQLMRMAVSGSAPVPIADVAENPRGISWNVGGTILLAQDRTILRVASAGGAAETLVQASAGEVLYGPRLLPDGDTLLYSTTVVGQSWDTGRIVAESLVSGERTVLIEGGNDASYLATGHLVYAVADSLFAVRFDPRSLTVRGAALPVLRGVSRASARQTGVAQYDVAGDGTLVYVPGFATGESTLAWLDLDSSAEPVPLPVPAAAYGYPRLSVDGRRIVSDETSSLTGALWIWDAEAETRTRVATPSGGHSPAWSPDGSRIAYADDAGIWWRAANNTGEPQMLLSREAAGAAVVPSAFTPDGRWLVFSSGAGSDREDVGRIATDGNGTPEWLLADRWDERSPALAPNGRWIAYVSDESGGTFEVYVRPFPNVHDDQIQISSLGGDQPVWARDGTSLFYLSAVRNAERRLMSVDTVIDEPSFSFGGRRDLLSWPFVAGQLKQQYDVSPDGQQVLGLTTGAPAAGAEKIVIAQHWLDELQRLLPPELR